MVGEQVGSYRVIAKLGEGGMGAVYTAQHTLLGKKAAVKVLHPQLSVDPEFVTRFFNEARATTLIQHPGLVDVFDFGYLPGGAAFLVMEFLEGESLGARLRRAGVFPFDLLLDVARQIASALGAAHARGIVHRDLKPDNLFLIPDPDRASGIRVKILDFGIAKLSDDKGGAPSGVRTRTGALMGTPTYMSPEQCKGAGAVDHRSDIYALACILFEMAGGRPPFVAEGPGEVIAAHLFQPPPLLRSLRADASPQLEALLARMLSKKPDHRHATLAEVTADLDVLAGRPPSGVHAAAFATAQPGAPTMHGGSTTLSRSAAEIVVSAPPSPPSPSQLSQPGGAARRPWLLPLVGVVLLGGGAGIYFGAVRGPSTPAVVVNRPGPEPPRPPEKPVVETPPPRRNPPPAPAAPARIKLRIDSTPGGAEVYRVADGVVVGRTPWTEERVASQGELVFVVKLAGHRDHRVTLAGGKDSSATAKLEKKKIGGGSSSSSSSGSSGSTGNSGNSGNSTGSTTVIDPFADKK